ncbi:tumor necrosis factor-like [Salarias fasciatus]|uniref:tumor necrosis factor-like n=1 Tax=Salarias fasciatus TaxID=181472 RepID=UPI001176EABA|nr:tumor necrosis factor-like [Salarias fasciatus]
MEDPVKVCVEDPGRAAAASGGRSRLPAALLLCAVGLAAALLLYTARSTGPAAAGDELAGLRHALRQGPRLRAAIHLHGLHNSSLKTSVQWMDQVGQSHAQGGLRLEDNQIVIPSAGLYFVYSQASFAVRCGGDDPEDVSLVHLSHTVKRWSDSWASERTDESYHTILHSTRTACQQGAPRPDGFWYSAVYMGAVFSLRGGDRLSTAVGEDMLDKLEDEDGKTYFGVFAL